MATKKTSEKKKTVTKNSTKTVKVPKEKKARKPSGLDAAVQVLADSKEPMRSKDIVEKMLSQGLWSTNGKTPHATIYAAIIREIQNKGDASRFEKADRGRFLIRKGCERSPFMPSPFHPPRPRLGFSPVTSGHC